MLDLIMNHVKSRLGASYRRLELDDDDLINLLQQETLNTLSIYKPFYVEVTVDAGKDLVEGSTNTYNLPMKVAGQFRCIGVEKVIPTSMIPTYGLGSFGLLGSDLTTALNNYANSKLAAGVATVFLPPETWQYIHPGILRVFNIFQQNFLMVIMKVTHREDFGTVPPGLLETVKKLALADVANDLLGPRTFFQNISTPFAEINLDNDRLKEWADKRDDVIEALRKDILKGAGAKKIWVA
jgi:hypothetical protein